jgi:hypothetical protein
MYDYGKELPTDRFVLTSAWAITVSLLLGRVAWQVRTTVTSYTNSRNHLRTCMSDSLIHTAGKWKS